MMYVVHLTPDVGSLNLGDYIVGEAVRRYLYGKVLEGRQVFIVEGSKHLPLSNKILRLVKEKKKSIVVLSGTNLFHRRYTPFSILNGSWRVGISDLGVLKGKVVLFGVGTQDFPQRRSLAGMMKSISIRFAELFSDWMWRNVLNRKWVHITRDNATKDLLENMDLSAINLGCPTLWPLVEDNVLEKIPRRKSDFVVTTITDYNRDPKLDALMLITLLENYEFVYAWPQGSRDWDYLELLIRKIDSEAASRYDGHIGILKPSLKKYDSFLKEHQVDYVGTRLHGGIRALQRGRRSIIVGIDNRALSMSREFGLPVIRREDITSKLEEVIHSELKVSLSVDLGSVHKYLNVWAELVDDL